MNTTGSASCRATLPDGRLRRFDVTAAAVTAEARRTEVRDEEAAQTSAAVASVVEAAAPKPVRSGSEICISIGIVAGILTAIGAAIAFL